MTVYTGATIHQWERLTNERLNQVAKQSVNDLFQKASQTKSGTMRGGSVQAGFVPRNDGFLASSAVVDLNGGRVAAGENAYSFGVTGMDAGDTILLGWTAEYARIQHYRGWLWVSTAAASWQSIVNNAVARAMS